MNTLRGLARTMTATSPTTFVHLHTLDLRAHDSPSLHIAHHPSSSVSSKITHFLPIYIFDPRQLDLSEFPNTGSPPSAHPDARTRGKTEEGSKPAPRSRFADFHRSSPFRLLFLLQSILGLRETYRRSGGDLILGYGKPEVVVPRLVAELKKAGKVHGVWAQEEVTVEEQNVIQWTKAALDKQGVRLHLNDSKVLVPVDDLPFDRNQTPDVYTHFRKQCEGLGVGLGGMLKQPLKTTRLETGKVVIDIGGRKLKPCPSVDPSAIHFDSGEGGFLSDPALDDLYAKLSKPLFASPPLAGWPQATSSDKVPSMQQNSAIPFEGGEQSALQRLDDYVGRPGLKGDGWQGGESGKKYKSMRNGMIGQEFSTKFSSWLSLGCLSAREAGWRVGQLLETVDRKDKETYNNVYWILFELLWRDFFQATVYKYSNVSKASLFLPKGFSEQIDTYPASERPNPSKWHKVNLDDSDDPARRWCEGRTGVPFIDANMRELVQTGWMSNRGRQNVASFLVKDLYVDWRIGAEFFEMHLVDYDTCSNWSNWQYQAGVGNDPRASRQFNPIKQAGDYDAHGEYVRMWLPELKAVPDELVQTPWLLGDASKLGGYPSRPIVENPQWRKHYAKSHGGGKGSKWSRANGHQSHSGGSDQGRGKFRGRGGMGRGAHGGHRGPKGDNDSRA